VARRSLDRLLAGGADPMHSDELSLRVGHSAPWGRGLASGQRCVERVESP